jgi:hypothetical protein
MKNKLYGLGLIMLLNSPLAQATDFQEHLFTFLAVVMVVFVILLIFEDVIGASVFKVADSLLTKLHALIGHYLGKNSGLDSANNPESETSIEPIWPSSFMWFIAAFILGLVSLYFFPKPLTDSAALAVLAFLIVPVTSAYIAQLFSIVRVKIKPSVMPRNIFWQVFWALFGYMLVRLALAL